MAMRKFFVVISICLILASVGATSHHIHHDKKATQKSYVCPPNFMRLSYKCYYFSNTTATWQEAYWKCRDMKSNIATIKNGNQDKIVRRTLDHNALVPHERWIGGRYDWGTMSWKWAASGREIQFQGFEDGLPKQKEPLDWHCIILDPKKHYRWSSRSCTESKHYVCQTKLRKVDTHDKKKLQRQYQNKLNEVPVPEIIPNEIIPYNNTALNFNSYYDNNELDNTAAGYRPREFKIRKKKNKEELSENSYKRDLERRPRKRGNRNKKNRQQFGDREPIDKQIRYMTYMEGNKDPRLPRIAVEEFRYSK